MENDTMNAKEYLDVALGGNMNFGSLRPFAIEEIMDGYARQVAKNEALLVRSESAGWVSDEPMRETLNHVHEGMLDIVTKKQLRDCVLWIEKKYDDLDHNGVRGL
jgi:hypothetical protein